MSALPTVVGLASCAEAIVVLVACVRSRSVLMLAVGVASVLVAIPAGVLYITGDLEGPLLSLSAIARLLLYAAIFAAVLVRTEQVRDPRGVDATPRFGRRWHL